MALCAAGSESAFEALVERHSPAVYRYFRTACGDRDQAWDLVQETFLRVYKHRAGFRPDGTFRHWMFVIAANLARSDRRTRQRKPTPPSLDQVDAGEFAASAPGPEAAAVDAERLTRIRAALEALPPQQRDALRLRLLEGLSFEAIGDALDCPTGTARTRVHYGLKALRAKLEAGPGAER